MKIVLWCLSVLYYAVIKMKSFFYKWKILKSNVLPFPVICVGNITLGGTGKTSAVITLAKILRSQGKKIAILTRGYKRKKSNRGNFTSDVCIASDGKKILLSSEKVGDEPYLLAQKLVNIPVIVGKDRYRTGKLAKAKFDCETVILDDGFQNFCLRHNLDIVCVDCLNPLEEERLFPLGYLREPVSGLKRANIVLLTNTNLIGKEKLTYWYNYLSKVCPHMPIAESIYRPLSLHSLTESNLHLEVEFLRNKKVILLSAIANPLSFEKTIENLGAMIVKHYSFPDHHYYQDTDLIPLSGIDGIIVTTEKDAIKIKGKITHSLVNRIYALEVELFIARGEEIWQKEISQLFT